ncbi:hypothetical protein GBAR_LOCUS26424 [Geodia barretti]|uniref:Uncharacterized protein n=1 Tax=Geodia barretti TaxID=519541 RepID=A0AA35TGV7_GEOBA|nr:hypothetical protein GBAR_LOCUS26424 [Geodia barretti]
MREAIHALRCIFWCLRSTQSTRIDPTVRKPHIFSDLRRPLGRWYRFWDEQTFER